MTKRQTTIISATVRLIVRSVVASVLAGCFALGGSSAVAAPPPGTDYSQTYLRSADGTTLHADVLCPADPKQTDCLRRRAGERTPVLLEVGPYNAHGVAEFSPQATPPPPTTQPLVELAMQHDLWKRGYTTVYVDQRGFGGSTGCWDYFGPGTAADVYAAVRWAASRAWSTGKVAVVGGSATGATGVEALALNPPGLAAVATFSPIVDSYGESFAHGVRTWSGNIIPPLFEFVGTREPGSPSDGLPYHENWSVRTADPKCVAPTEHEQLLNANPQTAFWQSRDWLGSAAKSSVPVFGGQGFLEWNVEPDQGLSLYPRLRNLKGLWLGQFPHEPFFVEDPSIIGKAGSGDQFVRFLDHALLGTAEGDDPRVVVQEAPDLKWRAEEQWPPADAVRFTIPVRPGSYADHGGNAAGDSVDVPGMAVFPIEHEPVKGCELATPAGPVPVPGCGTWTFTQLLPYDVHLAGFALLHVHVSGPSSARLIALLYDVAPDGSAYLICRGASVLGDGYLTIRMDPQDWKLTAGHRFGLLLSGADDSWFPPIGSTGSQVSVLSGSLDIPALSYVRNVFLDGGPGIRWAEVKHTIQIDRATINAGSELSPLPPISRSVSVHASSMVLSVRPRHTRVGERTRFEFQATDSATTTAAARQSSNRPVSGAIIRFAGRTLRTDRRGRASASVTFQRAGGYRATAGKRGYTSATLTIRVGCRDPDRDRDCDPPGQR